MTCSTRASGWLPSLTSTTFHGSGSSPSPASCGARAPGALWPRGARWLWPLLTGVATAEPGRRAPCFKGGARGCLSSTTAALEGTLTSGWKASSVTQLDTGAAGLRRLVSTPSLSVTASLRWPPPPSLPLGLLGQRVGEAAVPGPVRRAPPPSGRVYLIDGVTSATRLRDRARLVKFDAWARLHGPPRFAALAESEDSRLVDAALKALLQDWASARRGPAAGADLLARLILHAPLGGVGSHAPALFTSFALQVQAVHLLRVCGASLTVFISSGRWESIRTVTYYLQEGSAAYAILHLDPPHGHPRLSRRRAVGGTPEVPLLAPAVPPLSSRAAYRCGLASSHSKQQSIAFRLALKVVAVEGLLRSSSNADENLPSAAVVVKKCCRAFYVVLRDIRTWNLRQCA